ncbi:MAG TPA: MFS transporter [Kofleriaceae bacterium]|nr:MFS transporter [Kofleriaceae bacterium]
MKRSPLLPIFLVVLVDILGFTIVYPLLPFYAEKFGASPIIATSLVAVYAVCSLVSTPIIGRLSDKYGRRRLLLLSQAGTCAGFLVLAQSQYLWMIFLGRILDGVTAGNLSIAQAYISDHTEAKDRARAFGIIGIAFGIGFFFGPGMAGLLQDYGLHVPFLVAAGLSAISMVCSYTLLEPGAPGVAEAESPIPQATAQSAPGGKRPGLFDLKTYFEYFGRPGLGALYLQFFCFSFAFSAFMSGFALFAERRFTTADGKPWTAHEVGLLFSYSGFLGMILQGGILGRLVKKLGEAAVVLSGFVVVIAAYLVLGAAHTLLVIMAVSTMSAYGNGVLRPVLTSQITQQVSRFEQGVAIGISSSLSSLAMAIAPLVGGWLITEGLLFPWTLVPAGAAALGLIAALAKRKQITSVKPTPT